MKFICHILYFYMTRTNKIVFFNTEPTLQKKERTFLIKILRRDFYVYNTKT